MFPSTSFPIYYSLIILLFDTIQSELLLKLLNKPQISKVQENDCTVNLSERLGGGGGHSGQLVFGHGHSLTHHHCTNLHRWFIEVNTVVVTCNTASL
jgi:hypothetical protein